MRRTTHAACSTRRPRRRRPPRRSGAFGDERFLKFHHSGAGTRQNYGYILKNQVHPYIGHQRISEVNRETFYNPLRTIRLPKAASKPVLVANHDQWNRFEASLSGFRPAQLYARINVTTWARRCEMISFRPRDFDLDSGMVTIARSAVYLSSGYHPSGKAGWLTKDNPKNGDWRRFTISKQLCFETFSG